MAYREAHEPPPDGEALAAKELGRRASRVRRAIILPSILVGIAGAVVGYLLVREVQFAFFTMQVPWISGVIGGMPPFAAALRIAQKLGDTAVRMRAPAWVEEQQRLHDLSPGVLDDYLGVL